MKTISESARISEHIIMKPLINAFLVIAIFLGVAGCAATYTPPATYTVRNSAEFSMPYDDVWSVVIRYLAIKGHQIKSMDKDNGVIVTEEAFLTEPGIWCDCGKRKNRESSKYTIKNVTNSSNIVRTRVSDAKTMVYITTTYLAALDYFSSASNEQTSSTIRCNSKGVFENEFLEQLAKLK
jgi:hypothetical protein